MKKIFLLAVLFTAFLASPHSVLASTGTINVISTDLVSSGGTDGLRVYFSSNTSTCTTDGCQVTAINTGGRDSGAFQCTLNAAGSYFQCDDQGYSILNAWFFLTDKYNNDNNGKLDVDETSNFFQAEPSGQIGSGVPISIKSTDLVDGNRTDGLRIYYNSNTSSCTTDGCQLTAINSDKEWDSISGAFQCTLNTEGSYFQCDDQGSNIVDNYYYLAVGSVTNLMSFPFQAKPSAINPPPPSTLTPIHDSFILHNASNSNNGASTYLKLSYQGKGRGLIQFNESQIQAAVGSDPNYTATLQFAIASTTNNWSTGRQIDVNRMNQSWTEGIGSWNQNSTRGTGSGVTWNCATDTNIANDSITCSGTNIWDMIDPGSYPFVSTPTATTTITNNQTGIVSFNVTSDVKAFLNGTNNNGWLIKKDDETKTGDIQFGSKESSNSPILIITPQ